MSERRQLINLAYRGLGSLADAEDVVQETSRQSGTPRSYRHRRLADADLGPISGEFNRRKLPISDELMIKILGTHAGDYETVGKDTDLHDHWQSHFDCTEHLRQEPIIVGTDDSEVSLCRLDGSRSP
jgi:hypothetical protein